MANIGTLSDAVKTVANQTIINDINNLASSMYSGIMNSLIGLDITQFCEFNKKNDAVMRFHMSRNDVQKSLIQAGMGQNAYADGNPDNEGMGITEYSYTTSHSYVNMEKNIGGLEESGQNTTRSFDNNGNLTNRFFDYNQEGSSDDQVITSGQVNFSGTTIDQDSMLYKTRQLFQAGKIKSIISKFHTDGVKYPGQIGSSTFGESHGRNLLTYSAENGNGASYSPNGYDNPYCRVWTHHYSYDRLSRSLRSHQINGDITNSINYWGNAFEWNDDDVHHKNYINTTTNTKESGSDGQTELECGENYDYAWRGKHNQERRQKYSVLNEETGLVTIAPKYLGESWKSGRDKNIHTKACMFSIENLAWKDYDPYSFEQALSWEQRGPFGGRIMWFPPYNLHVTENNTAKWNQQEFIGRGEPVYTYINAERTGTLTFTMLVDHPSSIDYTSWHDSKKTPHTENDYHRYFAGCFDNTDEDLKGNGGDNLLEQPQYMTDEYTQVKPDDPETYTGKKKSRKPITPETDPSKDSEEVKETIKFYVFFPNNYSGVYDIYGKLKDKNGENDSSPVDTVLYLLFGKGAEMKDNIYSRKFTSDNILTANTDIGNGYEMSDAAISYDSDNKFADAYRYYLKESVKEWYRIDHRMARKNNKLILVLEKNSAVNTAHQAVGAHVADNHYDTKSFKLNSSDYAKNEYPGRFSDVTHNFAEFAYAYYKVTNKPEIANRIRTKLDNSENENAKLKKLVELISTYTCNSIKYGGYSSQQGYTNNNAELCKNRGITICNWIKEYDRFKNIEPTQGTILGSVKGGGSDDNDIKSKLNRSAYIEMSFSTTVVKPVSHCNNVTDISDGESDEYTHPVVGKDFDATYWHHVTEFNITNFIDTTKYYYDDDSESGGVIGENHVYNIKSGQKVSKSNTDNTVYQCKYNLWEKYAIVFKFTLGEGEQLTDEQKAQLQAGDYIALDNYTNFRYVDSIEDSKPKIQEVTLYMRKDNPYDTTEESYYLKQVYIWSDNDFDKLGAGRGIRYYETINDKIKWLYTDNQTEFKDIGNSTYTFRTDVNNGVFDSNTKYKKNDICLYQNEYYACRLDFVDETYDDDDDDDNSDNKVKKQSDYNEFNGFEYLYSVDKGDGIYWDYYKKKGSTTTSEQTNDGNSQLGASTNSGGDEPTDTVKLKRSQIIEALKTVSYGNQLKTFMPRTAKIDRNDSQYKGTFSGNRSRKESNNYSKGDVVYYNPNDYYYYYMCKVNNITTYQPAYPWKDENWQDITQSTDIQKYLTNSYTYQGIYDVAKDYSSKDVVLNDTKLSIITNLVKDSDIESSASSYWYEIDRIDSKKFNKGELGYAGNNVFECTGVDEFGHNTWATEAVYNIKEYSDTLEYNRNYCVRKNSRVYQPIGPYNILSTNDTDIIKAFKSYKEDFDSTKTYSANDVVLYNTKYYVPVLDTKTGNIKHNEPVALKWDESDWTELTGALNSIDKALYDKIALAICTTVDKLYDEVGVDTTTTFISERYLDKAVSMSKYGSLASNMPYTKYFHDSSLINTECDLSNIIQHASITLTQNEVDYIMEISGIEPAEYITQYAKEYIVFYQILNNVDKIVNDDESETDVCSTNEDVLASEQLKTKTEIKKDGETDCSSTLWVDMNNGILVNECELAKIKTQTTQNIDRSDERNKLRYDQEYYFYKQYMADHPIIFNKLQEKIKYFNPAYHSMTPEGFNSRLTFLNQCTRQGNTLTRSDEREGSTANNLAFGRPPYCVLRLGDFYNQMIVIDGISYNYDISNGLQWDLNPEGNGVQPMLCEVSISFKFIGGGDITGPVRRLQNAMSFNYYANTSFYDNRADRIVYQDTNWETMGGAGNDTVDLEKSSSFDGKMYK